MKTITIARQAGFTLVEIMIVVAILGLLTAIAVPSYVRSRSTSQQTACINNLRQIDAAIDEWAMECGKHNGDPVGGVATVSAYIKLNANNGVPQCPAGGVYTTSSVGHRPQVSCSLSTLESAHELP